MAFTNLFRRHSGTSETQGANYVCTDANSTAETLLDELETQCRTISSTKRNSAVLENSSGLLASTYSAVPKRHASVDYSWLSPHTNLLQVKSDIYHLPDMIKMELTELIRNVSPADCTLVVNQFRRQLRSHSTVNSPETVIAIFRKTISEYIDEKPTTRVNNHEVPKSGECIAFPSTNLCSLVKNNRILPKYPSEDEQHSVAELTQISLTSMGTDGNEAKPRSNTCI